MPRTVPIVLLALAVSVSAVPAAVQAQPAGEEVCATSAVEGASGQVCARRDGFGVAWTAQLADTVDDGRRVSARIRLAVDDARDPSVEIQNGTDESVVSEDGRFAPNLGSALRSVTIETCVDIRLRPDRCATESIELPQLEPSASAEQLERLDELVFGLPIVDFVEVWAKEEREGVDATFDWTSDGCSAGPFRDLFDERLQLACIRHDFAYRNLGQMGLAPTDEVRRRVDARLAADIEALEQGLVTGGFETTLQRFGGPVFHGEDLATLWGVPDFIVTRLGTPELRDE